MTQLYSTLEKYFGYSSFRPLQESIIQDILANKDVFVLMPTGGGKSLCYELPSLMQDGVTIVISPLISLMKDQVDGLLQNGVKAAFLNSSLLPEEQNRVIEKLLNNNISLLYVAPERLVQFEFLELLKKIKLNFFAIDEAHCISQWGHDFRPEYRQLDFLRNQFSQKPIMALTATATPRVKKDILERLSLKNPNIYQASFNRSNLTYEVTRKRDGFNQVHKYIQKHTGESGIIYCFSRKRVDEVAKKLQEHGIKALPYHAGMTDELRRKNQERFIHEDVDVMIATIAFGMGIDKPNVRYVIHYDLPKTLEHYYQETGRAGRDGLPSECIFLFSYGDKFFYERIIAEKETEDERIIAKSQLQKVIEYAESKLCRRSLLLHYFAEKFDQQNCASCDNCLSTHETFDATVIAQKILSCVYRVRQRFGAAHIANILIGSKSKKVLGYNHHLLSTYNIVNNYSAVDVKMFITELIQQGYLTQTQDQYGLLRFTQKSKNVLQGNEKVFLTKLEEKEIITGERFGDLNVDKELFNRLRAVRKRLADAQNIPPYIIFSDASLKDMATFFPQNKEQFALMKGVGEQKIKTYATIFLHEIVTYCESRHIDFINPKREKKTKKLQINKKTPSIFITSRLFQQGLSIEKIAEQRGFSPRTIISHLEQAYIQGEDINFDKLVSPDKQRTIIRVFKELQTDRLTPVKQALGQEYSFEEIQLTRAQVKRSNRS